jgi:C4-dicarboxylate-specific signal transduction histidine kinase
MEFDLAKVVREVADLLLPQAAGLGVGINVSGLEPTPLTSDRDGLRQVFLNLILNAVEAAAVQESGRVDVTVFVKGREIEVAVEDNGPGLGSKDPADLFLPFETGKTKGSGLGLAVSKRIVERIGGSILLSEKKEGGVRCLVRIPKESK